MYQAVQADGRRARTGIPGLDDILGGGLIPHRLYLAEGDPGAGKTTMALQFLQAGRERGEKTLYITLSETKAELVAGAASHGWSLDGIEIVELLANADDLDGDSQVTMFHTSEVELHETTRQVLEAVSRTNPTRLVFDSLSELRLLAQSPLRYRRQILALKQFFIDRKCTVLLLDDRTADAEDQQVQSIAHGVLMMEQMIPLYGGARRRLRVSKFRGTAYRGGYHDYTIQTGGLVVFPRLIAAEHDSEFPRQNIQSGVNSLDVLLGGGLDRGTSTLLLGPAGTGKSTVALRYAIAAAERGDHAAVFNFDEGMGTLRNRLGSLGIEYRRGSGPGEVRIQQIDPAEVSAGEFAFMVKQAVEVDGARVVVIDSLNGYMHSMPEEKFLTAQMHELLSYLARQGVTTLLVLAQHGMFGSSMQTPIDASYLADSVILFRYFETEGKVKKAVSILKKRSGPHEETIRELWFDSHGIHLSEPLNRYRGVLTGVPVELKEQANASSAEGRS